MNEYIQRARHRVKDRVTELGKDKAKKGGTRRSSDGEPCLQQVL